MTEQSDVVGTASIQLTVDPAGLQEAMQEAVTTAISGLNTEIKLTAAGGVDAAASEKGQTAPATPGAKSAAGKASTQGVDAPLNVSSITGINEAIQKAIGSHAFNIGVNGEYLIGSIQRALNDHQFSIQVKIAGDLKVPQTIEIDASQVSGAALNPNQGGQPAQQAGPPVLPPQVQRTLAASNDARNSLQALYRRVHEAMGTAGQSWGSVDPEGSDEASMLRDLITSFGDDIQKFANIDRSKKIPKDMGGGTIDTVLKAAGVPDETIKVVNTRAQMFQEHSAKPIGGAEPLSALVREHGQAIRESTAPHQTATITNAQHAAANPIVQPTQTASHDTPVAGVPASEAPEPPRSQTAGEILAEMRAKAAAAERAAADTATIGAAEKGETRGSAKVLTRKTLDESIEDLKIAMSGFPVGKTQPPPNAFDQERVPKFDQKTGQAIPGAFDTVTLSAEEIMTRAQDQLPTPVSPTGRYSYSQLERAAQSGAFSYRAQVIGANNKPTGDYVTYDPTSEDEEIQGFAMKNKVFNIDQEDAEGRRLRAKPISPSDYARALIQAGDAGPSSGNIVPHEDLQPMKGQPESQAFAQRVISKIVPRAASAFDRTIQAIKIDKPLGERSGNYTGSERTLQQLVQADEEYAKAYKAMDSLQMMRDAMEEKDPGRKRIDARIEERRGEMAKLEQQGADPAVARFSLLNPIDQARAIRGAREDMTKDNLANQERLASGVGLSDFEKAEAKRIGRGGKAGAEDFRNFDIAGVTLQKMADFSESVRSGKKTFEGTHGDEPFELMSAEGVPNVPEGYEIRDTQQANRANIVRANLAKIMDDFKEGIGEKRTGDTAPPKGYGSILGPMISAVFRDLVSEPGPGQPALRSSVSEGDRRKLQSPSWAEQARVQAEGQAHRTDRRQLGVITSLDQERATLEGRGATPRGESVKPRHDEILPGTDAWMEQNFDKNKSQDPQYRVNADKVIGEQLGFYSGESDEEYQRRESLRRQQESSAVKQGIAPGAPLPRQQASFVAGANEEQLRAGIVEVSPAPVEPTALDRAMEPAPVARGQEGMFPEFVAPSQRIAEIDQIQDAARKAILRASGQRKIEGPNLGPDMPAGLGRSSPELNPEETMGAIDADAAIPEDVKTEAREMFAGRIAPGFRKGDAERRAGEAGVEGLTGDRTREITQDQGVFVAGEMPPPSAEAGGGNGRGAPPTLTGLTPGGPNGPEGGDNRVSGGIQRVLVTNASLQVHMAGTQAPPSAEARAAVANSQSGFEYKQAQQAIHDARDTTKEVKIPLKGPAGPGQFTMPENTRTEQRPDQGRAFKLYEQLRGEGLSDPAIKKTLGSMGFGPSAEIIMGRLDTEEGGSGGGGGTGGTGANSAMRARNARRQRFGLDPIAARDESFYGEVDKADIERSELMAQARKAERGIPKRGFTASVTDIFSNIGGALDNQVAAVARFQREGGQLASILEKGPAIQRRKDIAGEELRAGQAIQAESAPLIQEVIDNGKNLSLKPREIQEYQKALNLLNEDVGKAAIEYDAASVALEEHTTKVADQRKRLGGAEAELPGLGSKAFAFGVGGLAAGGAFAVGSLVVQGTTMVMQAVAEAVGPTLERALGDFETTKKYVGVAGEAQLAAGGRQNVAQAGFAQAVGLSFGQAEAFQPVLDEGQAEAGNKRLQEVGGALRALRNIEANGPKGTFQGTSGLLGSFINQIPATAQIVGGIAKDFVRGDEAPERFVQNTPTGLLEDEYKAKGQAGTLSTNDIMAYPYQMQYESLQQLTKEVTGTATTPIDVESAQYKTYIRNLEYTNTALGVLNDGLERGGETVTKFSNTFEEGADAQKQADILRAKGDVEMADAVEKGVIALVDAQGKAITDEDEITSSLSALAKGVLKLDAESIVQQNAGQIQAQIGIQMGQLGLRTGTLIPSQFGIQETVAPTADPTSALAALGVGGLGGIGRLLGRVETAGNVGAAQAEDFVRNGADIYGTGQTFGGFDSVDPAIGDKFAAAMEKAASFGDRIVEIGIDVSTARAAFSAEQYAFQHYQAVRSLRDAKGLTGEIGQADRDNLGVLERRQFLLQREAQALQLGLSQKQINFQVALAGFTAPGDTPQERAARIKQAEIEADYAQKQLDIQKELFGLQGRQFKITASRQVNDLSRQLGLLEEGHEVELKTAKAEAKIALLTKLQQRENQKIEAYFEAATQRSSDVMGLAHQLTAETGEAFARTSRLAINAFNDYYKNFIAAVQNVGDGTGGGAAGGTASGIIARREKQIGEDLNNNGIIGAASGYAGMTNGLTDFTVGEVGSEAVAILKNPRSMAPSQMGGGDTYNITITGNDFKSEKDMDVLVQKLERALSKKGSLMGYRRPF